MSSLSTAVIGSTGLVGSHILSTLLATDLYKPVNTITRRAPKATSPLLNALIETDTTKWSTVLKDLNPTPATVFSALGTTRAAAGSLAEQWKIDHDLNIELAKAAKEKGSRTFVFISSGGTRGLIASRFPYGQMKNGVEDAIKDLDFEQAIILKPGMILGHREQSRMGESQLQTAVRVLGSISTGLKNHLGQEAEVIGRAAVRAAQLADEGKAPSKYWILYADEIIKLGHVDSTPASQAAPEDKVQAQ
ncbi:hypothetical protein B0T10DRAFT_558543 [Thelonectria olida]|uniref:NAD-dependent epimerase/dehydratase domain-containing protein n=1 Tax=Thelonectria olida TaxID=1576542 RepID=A0A9P9AVI7_9HYPO|nr:hypothetical protein B0T10DRAFT_558543 [Thelonectria olida]